MINKPLAILGLLAVTFLGSCGGDRLFESYHDFPTPYWHQDDTVLFEPTELSRTAHHPIITIKYTDRYDYHNLYLKMITRDSTSAVLKDTLINIGLFDPRSGKPMGNGFGNRFTKIDTIHLQAKEIQSADRVEFLQYMRSDSIQGIESIGLKLLRKPL